VVVKAVEPHFGFVKVRLASCVQWSRVIDLDDGEAGQDQLGVVVDRVLPGKNWSTYTSKEFSVNIKYWSRSFRSRRLESYLRNSVVTKLRW